LRLIEWFYNPGPDLYMLLALNMVGEDGVTLDVLDYIIKMEFAAFLRRETLKKSAGRMEKLGLIAKMDERYIITERGREIADFIEQFLEKNNETHESFVQIKRIYHLCLSHTLKKKIVRALPTFKYLKLNTLKGWNRIREIIKKKKSIDEIYREISSMIMNRRVYFDREVLFIMIYGVEDMFGDIPEEIKTNEEYIAFKVNFKTKIDEGGWVVSD